MKIQYLWHSFFRLSFNGVDVLVDPFMEVPEGDLNFKVNLRCPVGVNKLKGIDLICVSNEHFDHFDKKLVEAIAKRENSVVVAHESVLNELKISPGLKHKVMSGDVFTYKGLKVEVKEAHYPNSFYPLGFYFSKDGESVYFAGNTSLLDSFSTIKSDVAIIPIGGNSTMDVIDAVKATKTMKPKYVIPMHYNSFDTIMADPVDFKSRIEKSVLKTVPVILKPGQVFKF
jgi:L-ascorbate metabolism protein UlaG (beta-lactamase superfamily)